MRIPTVVEVTGDASALDEIGRLRVAAWQTEIVDFPEEIACWIDAIDRDPWTHLYAIRDAGQVVASARLTVHRTLEGLPDGGVYTGVLPRETRGPIGVMSRLVVHPDHRRRGYGTSLDRYRILVAREYGCRLLVGCSSAELRIRQMQRLGFQVAGRQTTNPHPVFQSRGLQSVLVLPLG